MQIGEYIILFDLFYYISVPVDITMTRKIAHHPIFDVISDTVDRNLFAHLLVTDNTVALPFVCSIGNCTAVLSLMTAFQRMTSDGWCPNHRGIFLYSYLFHQLFLSVSFSQWRLRWCSSPASTEKRPLISGVAW